MTGIDSFVVAGVDVGAERMECPAAVLAAQRATPFAITRVVLASSPWLVYALGRAWVEPVRVDPTPPVGTPGAVGHGGNSTPARTLVAGRGKSPVSGPVLGR